jgi:hypothetical protein
LFFNRSNGDISIQLTVETGDVPGEVTDSFHLALATPSVHAVMVRLETFCHQYDVKMVSEDLGQGKLMVKIPDVFYGAFEFVPYHSF